MTDANDAESILMELAAAHPGGQYLPMDRYRDFRTVFLGTDQGKRVLQEILRAGHYFTPLAPKAPEIDPYALAMGEGARRLVLAILAITNTEPPAQKQTRTNSERGKI